ncbi:hypothetical protein SALBM217S_04868 [Streptomyces griseoloalbus]
MAALFHDTGLVPPYRSDDQRFEMDGADQARAFLLSHDIPAGDADTVWTAVALHTTPEVPYKMAPRSRPPPRASKPTSSGCAWRTSAGPRSTRSPPRIRPDFKQQILQAFTDGFKHRPDTTFGTVNADVLEHFVPGFRRTDFVEVIQNSAWPDHVTVR